ncbi:MAG: hypothetical protein AAB953_03630 [Patescibacteria group bacterium]
MNENLPENQPPQTPPLVEKPIESQEVQDSNLATPETINFKKYIIAIIVGVAFLGSIFIGYVFFFKNANHETSTVQDSELDNKLSGDTDNADASTEANNEPKSELEKAVNEIKDEYGNDSAPPSMTITIPDGGQTENSTTPEVTESPTDTETPSEDSTPPEATKIPR